MPQSCHVTYLNICKRYVLDPVEPVVLLCTRAEELNWVFVCQGGLLLHWDRFGAHPRPKIVKTGEYIRYKRNAYYNDYSVWLKQGTAEAMWITWG